MEKNDKILGREAIQSESGAGMSLRFSRLILERGLWEEVMDLVDDPDRQVGFRAVWSLEKAFFAAPETFRPYLDRFLAQYLATTNPSVQRSYSKMLAWMLRTRYLRLGTPHRDPVVTVCFDRLIDSRTPIAVAGWTMTILDLLSPLDAWADEAFTEILRTLSQSDSPGVRSGSSKLIKKRKLK